MPKETTMSNRFLLPEIIDYIVDDFIRETQTLQNCGLVSKSWVPSTRKQLFADVRFTSPKALESWKKTFPDPRNSPGYHTLNLFIDCPEAITAADTEEGGWIQAFSRVVRLYVNSSVGSKILLAPLYGFSLTLKALHVTLTAPQGSQVFELVLSFPLLDSITLNVPDLLLDDDELHPPRSDVPATSPTLTGIFMLLLVRGLEIAVRRLLDFPNSLHFKIVVLSLLRKEDIRWATELVARCSHTLECLDIMCRVGTSISALSWTWNLLSFTDDSSSAALNLSRATKLQIVIFELGLLSVDMITMALRTITSEHRDLVQISIYADADIFGPDIELDVEAHIHEQWSELDRILFQLWESGSIHPQVVVVCSMKEEQKMRDFIGWLLPEVGGSGVLDMFTVRKRREFVIIRNTE